MSLAANAKGIGLSFLHGSGLQDPHGILQGSGTLNRFVRLVDGAGTLATRAVRGLLDTAEAQSDPPFGKAGSGGGKLISGRSPQSSVHEDLRDRKGAETNPTAKFG